LETNEIRNESGFRRQRQKNQKLKASLGCTVSLKGLDYLAGPAFSKKKKVETLILILQQFLKRILRDSYGQL
jgi:hypothetical protein